MTLSDWTEQDGEAHQNQSSDQAYSGTYSWKFDDVVDKQIITLDQSGVDQPQEARIKTAYRRSSTGSNRTGFIFRYQDLNNFYHVRLTYNTQEVWLNKVMGGTLTLEIDSAAVNLPSEQWYIVDPETYVDSGGAYNVRVRVDSDDDGTYEDIVTLQDPANDLSNGGAVGFGRSVTGETGKPVDYFDETEVYY